jgi:hypothetical protein
MPLYLADTVAAGNWPTQTAHPIVLPFDDFAVFGTSAALDLWSHLSGLALFAQRSASEDWSSLNPAVMLISNPVCSCTGSISGGTLTVTTIGMGALAPGVVLSGFSVPAATRIAAQITGIAGGTGTYSLSPPGVPDVASGSIWACTRTAYAANPVPLMPAQHAGIPHSELVYNNHAIVGAPGADTGQGAALPPLVAIASSSGAWGGVSLTPVPAMRFGDTPRFLIALLGPGGTLPAALRATTHPAVLAPDATALAALAGGYGRQVAYLRRVPVGPIRIAEDTGFPKPPATVTLLGPELPTRPGTIALAAGKSMRFFMGERTGTGRLDFVGATQILIELGELRLAAGSIVALHVWSAFTDSVSIIVTLGSAAPGADPIYRQTAGTGETIRLRLNTARLVFMLSTLPDMDSVVEGEPTEQPLQPALPWPAAEALRPPLAPPAAPPPMAWLEVSVTGGPAQFLAPSVQVGTGPVQYAPEDGKPERQAIFAGGMGSTVSLLRPSVDFETWHRWTRRPGDAMAQTLADQINQAYGQQMGTKSGGPLCDPAVSALAITLRQVFPVRSPAPLGGLAGATKVVQFPASPDGVLPGNGQVKLIVAWQAPAQAGPAPVLVATGTAPAPGTLPFDACLQVDLASAIVTVIVPAGTIIDIDLQPAMLDADGTGRFADGLCCGRSFQGYTLFSPVRLRAEAPIQPASLALLAAGAPWVPPPAVIAENSVGTNRFADFTLSFPTGDQTIARYFSLAVLKSQLWGWRGRPAPVEVALAPSAHANGNYLASGTDLVAYTARMFEDRSTDDIGPIDSARLTYSHIRGQTVLFRKDLDWRDRHNDGANLWRFLVQYRSRYADYFASVGQPCPDMPQPKRGQSDYQQPFLLLDTLPAAAAELPPPALSLIMPLTRRIDTAGDLLPPVMILLDGGWHNGNDVADRLDAVIETVRYPIPHPPGPQPSQRYFQQVAPDPILTGIGNTGTIVPAMGGAPERFDIGDAAALRLDGAAGWTEDVGEDAPRFNATSFLATLVPPANTTVAAAAAWRAFPLMRLRLRRLRETAFLAAATKLPVTAEDFVAGAEALELRIAHIPPVLGGGAPVSFTVTVPASASTGKGQVVLTVTTDGTSCAVAGARDGESGPRLYLSLPRPSAEVPAPSFTLRVVVSPTGRTPQGGLDVVPYLTHDFLLLESAGSRRDPWLRGAVLVSDWDGPQGGKPVLGVAGPGAAGLAPVLSPLRASRFTSPYWCQATPDFSQFLIVAPGGVPPVPCTAADLVARMPQSGAASVDLWQMTGSAMIDGELAPGVAAAANSRAVFVLRGVVTCWETDGSGQPAERVLGGGLTAITAGSIALAAGDAASLRAAGGRVRIVTIMGLVGSPVDTPKSFFNVDGDASARVAGVSLPIEVVA